ncbi:hypothetical protein R1flu_011715 [Riccia fluitans]|uniref:Uncharacterized protein n=1 Tax=Riccia fluitans TaxID=41844 RepID=A0ABD1Z8K5_9MARC
MRNGTKCGGGDIRRAWASRGGDPPEEARKHLLPSFMSFVGRAFVLCNLRSDDWGSWWQLANRPNMPTKSALTTSPFVSIHAEQQS